MKPALDGSITVGDEQLSASLPTLTQLAERDGRLYQAAKAIIESGEQHAPILFVYPANPDKPAQIVDLSPAMSSENGKAAISKLIRIISAQPEVDTVCFVSEGWAAQLAKPNQANQAGEQSQQFAYSGPPPSQRDDRQEVLTVAYTVQDGTRAFTMHRIKGEGATRTLERGNLVIEGQDGMGMDSRFFGARPTAH